MSLTTRIGVAVGAVLVAVFAATSSLVTALPAHAHDQVVASSPADGESLDVAPTEVTIEFTDELLAQGYLINVTNAEGADVTDGDATLNGRVVNRALQPNLPNGQYAVVWRVVSADGHPITDTYQFAIGEPVDTATDAHADDHADDLSADTQPTEVTALTGNESPIDWGRIASFALLGAFGGIAIYVAILALIRRTTNKSERK